MRDRVRALEMLGRMHGDYVDKVDATISGNAAAPLLIEIKRDEAISIARRKDGSE